MKNQDTLKTLVSRAQQRKLTSERRAAMKIMVLSFNLSNNKLSQVDKFYLKLLFLEAKYYYNYLLYLSKLTITDDFGNMIYPYNLFKFDTKIDNIQVYNSSFNLFEPYELTILSSQMRQKILDKLLDNIKALSEKKKNGFKVGELKYKSYLNVPLKQFNNSYYLDDDFKYLSLQGNVKKHFKLVPNKALNKFSKELGFDNLSLKELIDNDIIEMANAEVIRKNNRYKFNLTVYINPVVFDKKTQSDLVQDIRQYTEYKSYKKVRIHKERYDSLKTDLKVLSKSIQKSFYINDQSDLDNVFECIKKHYEVKEFGVIRQFHMNLTQEQLDLLSNTCVGIDAGIASEMTLNCSEVYRSFTIDSRNNIYLQHTLDKIKHTQTELNHFIQRSKKLNRRKGLKGYNKSRAYHDIKNRLNKLWTKYENIKDNMVNHIVSFLKHFRKVYFQEELISKWKQDKLKGYGKKIQQGILGKVYAKLKRLAQIDPDKYKMLPKHSKTTQTCPCCERENKVKLFERFYSCSCGYQNHRDTHSGFNMIYLGNLTEKLLNSNKVSGIDSSNLVKILTADNQTVKIHSVVMIKLMAKAHINSVMNSYENTSEAPSFLLKSSAFS